MKEKNGSHFLKSYNSSVPEERLLSDLDTLKRKVELLKELGLKIVLTSGTFDILHVGHARYLEKAKELGDVLVVGVDSDKKTKKRKGPHRPVVPEDERVEMLCHTRYADLVVLKEDSTEKWALIKAVRPDVLQLTVGTYDDGGIKELEEFCGEVVVFESQATTSATAKIRRVMIDGLEKMAEKIQEGLGPLIRQALKDTLDSFGKKKGDSK